jgi:outer membrane lipoprotein-sorting protein
MKRAFCLLLVLSFASFSQAQGSYTLEQVYAKIDEVAKTFRTAQADIERTHVTVVVDDKDVSSGKFYYVRRGKEPRLRLELTKPAVQQLVIDNGKLQLYQPSLKQVQEASIGNHQDKVEMIMALGFGQSSQELKQNFTVSLGAEDTIDGKKTTVLLLKPKDSKMFSSIQMWMDQQRWTSVQVKTTEASGDYMIFKFSNVRLNAPVADSMFQLKLPKDVHVIKM